MCHWKGDPFLWVLIWLHLIDFISPQVFLPLKKNWGEIYIILATLKCIIQWHFSPFTMRCNQYLYLVLNHFLNPKRKRCAQQAITPCSLLLRPLATASLLSVSTELLISHGSYFYCGYIHVHVYICIYVSYIYDIKVAILTICKCTVSWH